MRKDERFYTFLLTHTTKDRIYIRRVEISKKMLHSFAMSAVLMFTVGSFGLFSVLNSGAFRSFAARLDAENQTAALSADRSETKSEPVAAIPEGKPLDYSRPVSTEFGSENSGGPNSGSFQLTTESTSALENDVEKRLRQIEAESNPRFLPTIWAHIGKINNEFGFRRNPFGGRSYEFHAGMDIDGEKGDMVVAPANGIVVKAGWQGGYGNLIEIDHGNGLTTRYGHLSKIGIKVGDQIQRGQLIALVGSTGRSTGPHLHYELRLDDKAINPRRFLPPEPSKIQ
ncbi:MAG: M23 family metallopeptidase [Pyrinomonadaceae bacterium]